MKPEKKIIRSFAELSSLVGTDQLEKEKTQPKQERFEKVERVEKIEKIKKEKQLYEGSNIRIRGTQLVTTDGNYETYSKGAYTSWRITIIGQKNGSTEIGADIADGYSHGSFHDRNRAATILIEMINRYKK